jgi:hypothetical protein
MNEAIRNQPGSQQKLAKKRQTQVLVSLSMEYQEFPYKTLTWYFLNTIKNTRLIAGCSYLLLV